MGGFRSRHLCNALIAAQFRAFSTFMPNEQVNARVKALLNHERSALSRTITLIESSRREHKMAADQIMKRLLQETPHRQNKALRIGICGAPGAGKSSVIEKLGVHIVGEGKKLAVLAVDPSSQRTGGSILGDKTRMDELAQLDQAYVRPSPTRGVLGGVALNTGEVQQLCEHVGYDVILIETVGVGQSEIEVDNVVDFVVYIVPPGSGDSLQGAKKGVMEIADLVCINKYDEEYKKPCQRLKRQIEGALSLTMSKHMYSTLYPQDRKMEWFCPVELISAKTDHNIASIWTNALQFREALGEENLRLLRQEQQRKSMWNYLGETVMTQLKQSEKHAYSNTIRQAEKELLDFQIGGHEAAQRILDEIFEG